MRHLYLIRHGKPDFPNGEKMCLGTADIPLGAEGLAQAQAMAKMLPPVTGVFSSGLSRALQTARAIGEPRVIPGLREYAAGAWDGLSFRDIRQRYPALYEARGMDPAIPIPGAEEPEEGLARFQAALREALDQSTGDIAVVAHGGVIAAFLESIGGKREKPGYAQILSLTYDGEFHLQEE